MRVAVPAVEVRDEEMHPFARLVELVKDAVHALDAERPLEAGDDGGLHRHLTGRPVVHQRFVAARAGTLREV